MSTFTPNYNLEKPASGDDFKDFTTSYGNNMDIIDANLGGGGGGNVDDVLVNGVSVVDGNHDAQITSYKEVTQAEYDALPATKLTDGIAYFIKDAGGGGGGSSSHNYSTTEQVIGTWIDGKPLYEITIVANSTNISGTLQHIDVSTLNIDTFVRIEGTFDRITAGNAHRIYPFNAYESSSYYSFARYLVEEKEIGFNITMASGQSTTQQVFTIQYTKTTDV